MAPLLHRADINSKQGVAGSLMKTNLLLSLTQKEFSKSDSNWQENSGILLTQWLMTQIFVPSHIHTFLIFYSIIREMTEHPAYTKNTTNTILYSGINPTKDCTATLLVTWLDEITN